jgi:hypothetical protein
VASTNELGGNRQKDAHLPIAFSHPVVNDSESTCQIKRMGIIISEQINTSGWIQGMANIKEGATDAMPPPGSW